MTSPLTFVVWAESLESMNYYDVLRIAHDAKPEEVQKAFHDLSLRCHPDRFVDEPEEVGKAAEAVFKRLVEAYNVLRRPQLRTRYDAELAKSGAVKLDEHAVQKKPTFEQRTLFMIARTPRAKQFAAKADAFLSNGQLEEARVQLVSAYQQDQGNEELKERLDMIYEALSLEPGDF
ncbi:MAG: J domain-containing protein [Deltaproteobacteria bacterium]|nr:J domain-containing protein [Deltaproteobacteria bacterium]